MFKFIFIIILFSQPLYSQLILWGKAPLSPGNYWKYYISNDGMTIADSFSYLVKDSLITINNNVFFVIESRSAINVSNQYLGLSSDNFYIRYNKDAEDSVFKYLKFDCQLGDSWNQFWLATNLTFTVTDTFTINAWGSYYKAKEIYFRSTNGFITMYQLWTDSLGLISEFNEELYTGGLAGCVINGVVYGDTSMFVTSINENIEPIKEFTLSQNYPNPFNPTTTISYYIPYQGNIKLKVYNIIAEEVASLTDEYQNKGNHSVLFNGKNLPSGVYIYKLEYVSNNIRTGNFFTAKSMVLIK